jgi:Pseudouridylate synthases, 23S RNA-specific
MEPTVLYEDNHLLVLNKPAGLLVQGDKTGDLTLTDWGRGYLKQKYDKPGAVFLHPAHRIDRPVSGSVLFARTDKALSRLTALFRDKNAEKTYLALCIGTPPEPKGELRHFLLKDEKRNVVAAFIRPRPDAKESITRYELLGKVGGNYCLRITPLTGRPHQIRAQLAAIGCSILGDLKYGSPQALPDASVGLHSWKLSFVHPVRQELLSVEAPLPPSPWWQQTQKLILT